MEMDRYHGDDDDDDETAWLMPRVLPLSGPLHVWVVPARPEGYRYMSRASVDRLRTLRRDVEDWEEHGLVVRLHTHHEYSICNLLAHLIILSLALYIH